MKKILIIVFILLPFVCHGKIYKMPVPEEFSKEERLRIIRFLNYNYDGVTEENAVFGSEPQDYNKNTYRGFFIKLKLLRNIDPIEVFFYQKHGICYACHESGMSVVGKKDTLLSSADIRSEYGELAIELIEYDNKGTCAIMVRDGVYHAGGVTQVCDIIRLNSRKKFQKIYSQTMGFADKYGDDISIGVTLTSRDLFGYGSIIIKEHQNPQMMPTVSAEDFYIHTPEAEIFDRTIIIPMRKYEYEDMINGFEIFFKSLFKKKYRNYGNDNNENR